MAEMLSRKVSTALDSMVAAVEQGQSPTAALKSASLEAGLLPDMIHMVGRAYNTGEQAIQVKEAQTIAQKFASFAIADIDAVIRDIYPNAVEPADGHKRALKSFTQITVESQKLAAQEEDKAASCDPAYSLPPKIKPKKVVTTKVTESKPEPMQKKAYVRQNQFASVHDFETGLRQAMQLQEKAKTAVTQLYDDLYRKQAAANVAAKTLVSYCQLPASRRYPLSQVKEGVAFLFGEPGLAFFDILPAVCKQELLTSRKTAGIHRCVATEAPYSLFADAVQAFQDLSQFRKEASTALAALHDHLHRTFAPYDPANSDYVDLGGTPPTKAANLVSGALGGAFSGALGQAIEPKEKLVQDLQNKLNNPQHYDDIRREQGLATVHELLNFDPIISSYSPEEVVGAYNEAVQLAPRLSTSSAALKPIIRKSLVQGSTEPFEIQQLLEMEKSIAQSATPDRNALKMSAPEV